MILVSSFIIFPLIQEDVGQSVRRTTRITAGKTFQHWKGERLVYEKVLFAVFDRGILLIFNLLGRCGWRATCTADAGEEESDPEDVRK
jgi:hypothetical protein